MVDRTRLGMAVAAVVLAVGVGALAVAVSDRGDGVRTGPATSVTTGSTSTVTSPPAPTPSTSTTEPPSSTTTASTTTTAISGEPAQAVRAGPSARPVVALTFDAGSDVGYAAEILDTLATDGISASFGVTGVWATAHPDLVRRMASEGHQLLNHTWDHPSFTGYSTEEAPLSRTARLDQLARAEAAIVAASGQAARPWFRPPFGDEDATVRADVGAAGYRYEAMWTIDSLGWTGLSPAEISRRCLEAAAPGAIYLFHVGAASADAQALPEIIDGLRARGLGFVTLDALVAG